MAARNFAFLTHLNTAKSLLKMNASANLTAAFSEEDLMGYPEYQAFTHIWHFCPPVLLGVGVPGNLVTIAVLRRMWRKGSAQLPFLLSLAFADLCLLVCGLLFDMSFYLFHCDLRHMHVLPCRILTFVMNSANSVAAWLLVAVTAQRAVSVTRPQRVAACCSLRVSCRVLTVIVLLACLLQLHVLLGDHVPGVHPEGFCTAGGGQGRERERKGGGEGLAWLWSLLDLFTSCLLPSLVLVLCNAVLIRGLRASARQLRHLAAGSTSRKRLAATLTTVVPFLSLSFLFLTSPIYVYILWGYGRRQAIRADPQLFARAQLAWAVTNMLWYANSTINFILYCGSGSSFRREFLLLMRQWFCCYCCFRARGGGDTEGSKEGVSSVEGKTAGWSHVSSKLPLASAASLDSASPGIHTVSSNFRFPHPAPGNVGNSGKEFLSWKNCYETELAGGNSDYQVKPMTAVSVSNLLSPTFQPRKVVDSDEETGSCEFS